MPHSTITSKGLFGILRPAVDKRGVTIKEARLKAAEAWVKEAAKRARK